MDIITIYSSDYQETGGVENVIRNLNEKLVKKGHSTKVICLTKSNATNYELINGIEVYRIKDNFYNYLMDYSIKFGKFLRGNRKLFGEANIIHVHGHHSLFSWQVIRQLHKQGYVDKLVFNPHYEGFGSTFINTILLKLYKIIAKTNFELPQRIVFVSEYEMNNVINNFRIDQSKITVIPNGINYTVPEDPMVKKIKGSKLNLLYVGRVKKKKGIHYILKAIKLLNENYSLEVEFSIVGMGNYINKLRTLAEKDKLDNINFLGRVSDEELEALYRKSDIFLLLSKSEAYGIVVAEALVHGLIVIVSNNAALKEFVEEKGCFGIVYPPDPEKLASLILKSKM